MAKAKGVFTILNPAPGIERRCLLRSEILSAPSSLPTDIYKYCDIICPNETESEILTGVPVKNKEDAAVAAKILLERGAGNVIVTLGANGSLLASKNAEATHFPAKKVEAKVCIKSGL